MNKYEAVTLREDEQLSEMIRLARDSAAKHLTRWTVVTGSEPVGQREQSAYYEHPSPQDTQSSYSAVPEAFPEAIQELERLLSAEKSLLSGTALHQEAMRLYRQIELPLSRFLNGRVRIIPPPWQSLVYRALQQCGIPLGSPTPRDILFDSWTSCSQKRHEGSVLGRLRRVLHL